MRYLAAFAAAATLLAACTSAAATHEITGTVTTERSFRLCKIGTESVFEGEPVTIEDGSGAILAYGTLNNKMENGPAKLGTCTFGFTFPEVPTNETFYRIRLGVVYWDFNRADLEADEWALNLSTS